MRCIYSLTQWLELVNLFNFIKIKGPVLESNKLAYCAKLIPTVYVTNGNVIPPAYSQPHAFEVIKLCFVCHRVWMIPRNFK